MPNGNRIPIKIGEKKGKLTIIRLSKVTNTGKYWLCKCDCGGEKEITTSNFRKEQGTASCKACFNLPAYNRKYVGDISGLAWRHIVGSAKSRNIKVNITQREAWELFKRQNGKCALTGQDLCFKLYDRKEHGKDIYSEGTASLDRIDSTQGYSIENCQWVHKDVNWLKNRFSQERLFQLCRMITKHNNLEN